MEGYGMGMGGVLGLFASINCLGAHMWPRPPLGGDRTGRKLKGKGMAERGKGKEKPGGRGTTQLSMHNAHEFKPAISLSWGISNARCIRVGHPNKCTKIVQKYLAMYTAADGRRQTGGPGENKIV